MGGGLQQTVQAGRCERVPGPAVVRQTWAFLSTDSGACGTQRDSACGTSRSSSPAPHPASPEATRDLNFEGFLRNLSWEMHDHALNRIEF